MIFSIFSPINSRENWFPRISDLNLSSDEPIWCLFSCVKKRRCALVRKRSYSHFNAAYFHIFSHISTNNAMEYYPLTACAHTHSQHTHTHLPPPNSLYLSIYLSIYRSIDLSIDLYIYLSIYLLIWWLHFESS